MIKLKKSDNIIIVLLALYVIILPLTPIRYSLIIDGIVIICSLIYIFQIISNSEYRKKFVCDFKSLINDYLFLSMSFLLLIMVISLSYSIGKTISLKESLRFLYYIIIYFIIKTKFTTGKEMKYIFYGYLSTIFIMGIYGLYQFIFRKADVFLISLNVPRVQATFENTNAYGAYLVLALFPLLQLSIKGSKKMKKIYIVNLFLVITNLVLTFSRNAWMAFVIGLLLFIIFYNRKLILAIIGFFIFAMINPKIYTRILQFKDKSQNEGRMSLWKTAIKMIKDNPILGIGNGNFPTRYREYINRYPYLKLKEAEILPTHNSYLKVQCELGIFGSISFIAMLYLVLIKIRNVAKQYKNDIGLFYDGFIISCICFYIMNIFDNLMFVPKVTAIFWITVSIAASILYNKRMLTGE